MTKNKIDLVKQDIINAQRSLLYTGTGRDIQNAIDYLNIALDDLYEVEKVLNKNEE